MNPEKEYEEIGKNYRFFLNWRNLLFGGFIFIVGTLLFNTQELISCYPLIGFFLYTSVGLLSLLFRAMDNRIRDLYRGAINEGKKLETNVIGFYTAAMRFSNKIDHSSLLDIFYFSSAIFLLIASQLFIMVSIIRFTPILAKIFPNLHIEIFDFLLNHYSEMCVN